jgi:hypothetical protein
MAHMSSFPLDSIGFRQLHGIRIPKYIQYEICMEPRDNDVAARLRPRSLSLTFISWIILQCDESALGTFLALPSLLAAPRDFDRELAGRERRGLYEIDDELLNSLKARQLDFPPEFRHELAYTHSEIYLLKDDALTLSILEHKPLLHYRDPAKVNKATMVCNGDDPIETELQPILEYINEARLNNELRNLIQWIA